MFTNAVDWLMMVSKVCPEFSRSTRAVIFPDLLGTTADQTQWAAVTNVRREVMMPLQLSQSVVPGIAIRTDTTPRQRTELSTRKPFLSPDDCVAIGPSSW